MDEVHVHAEVPLVVEEKVTDVAFNTVGGGGGGGGRSAVAAC